MNNSLNELISNQIEKLEFKKAISNLQKIHNENDKEYLFLRCKLFYYQKNYYLSLDTFLLALHKFNLKIKSDKKFLSILSKILIGIERYDLNEKLNNKYEQKNLFEKIILWSGYN